MRGPAGGRPLATLIRRKAIEAAVLVDIILFDLKYDKEPYIFDNLAVWPAMQQTSSSCEGLFWPFGQKKLILLFFHFTKFVVFSSNLSNC